MKSRKKNSRFSDFALMDFALLIIVLMLVAVGLIMILSASAPQSISEVGNSYFYFKKQLGFVAIGIVVMIVTYILDYKIYGKFYKFIYVLSIVVLFLTQIDAIAVNAKGATRWVSIFGIGFQPSELAKLGLVLAGAGYINKHKEEMGTIKGTLYALGLIGIPLGYLFIFQSHLSACIVISVIIVAMLLSSGVKLKNYIISGTVAGSAAIGALSVMLLKGVIDGGYRFKRITTFFDPWKDKQKSGWQIIQGLYALGSGGLFGVGLGQGKQKYLYIPEPHNDFIFAIIGEELGFIGCLFIIVLYILFVWRGALAAMNAPDLYGGLVAVGITSLIGIQAIFNIAVVTASMPVTGMSLPFISYGGTSLIILFAAVGILLNISKQGKKE